MSVSARRHHSRWVAYAYLGLNTLVWGAAFVVVKPSFAYTTPYRMLLYRFLLASILVSPILWHYRRQLQRRFWQWVVPTIGIELLGTTLALGLLYEGLRRTSALEANLIATTLPLFVTVGGVLLLKEREQLHEWAGLLLALGATIWLTLEPVWQTGLLVAGASLGGNLLVLGHNVTNILYFPLTKKYFHPMPKILAASLGFYVGLVTFFLLSWLEQGWSGPALWSAIRADQPHPEVWLASGYMAVFGSIIGLTAYFKGQDSIESSEAILFQYLQPLVYIPLGFFVLGEVIELKQLLALAVILIGVVLAERRRHRTKST